MAKEIRPLFHMNPETGTEEIFYPATTSDSVVNPATGLSVTKELAAIGGKVVEQGKKLSELEGAVNELKELFGNDVEGYVRVSGISNPKCEYRNYKRGVGMESVFDVFKPCLVEQGTGKLLRVLDTLNWYKDEDGNDTAIDGSMGEVMICNVAEYYHITGHVTVNGVEYDVFLRSFIPFEWMGHRAEKCEPFGLSPHYTVAHQDDDNVTRMHSVYNPEWAGSYSEQHTITGAYVQTTDDEGNIVEEYDSQAKFFDGAGGLHTTGIALYTGEQYAMNMNEDTTKPVPFFNRTARCEELWFGHMMAEGGTFAAHAENLMGSGFSSNYSASAASHWEEGNSLARNGFRYLNASGAWVYNSFAINTSFGNGKTGDNLYRPCFLNQWRSHWKCMEQQRVLMYAHEHNIPELTWFTFEGNKYKWRHVDGFAGMSEGAMTAVVWKHFASKLEDACTDPVGGAAIGGNRCEFLISSAVFRGVITDVSPSWWMSGLLFTEDENKNYEAFMQRDQTKLIKSETGDKAVDEKFRFEEAFHHVGSYAPTNGYRKNFSEKCIMLPDTIANQSGASLTTYLGAYNYFNGSAAPAGKKSVRGFRRGYYASYSALSPLYVYAGSAPSIANSHVGFGTCVRLQMTESQTE